MFGNKHYTLKLAAAVALVAILGVISAVWGAKIEPEPLELATNPKQWTDEVIHIPEATVTAPGTIEVDGVHIRCFTPNTKTGDRVSLSIRSGSFYVDLDRGDECRILPPKKYPLGCTLIVVLLVLFHLYRHFNIHPKALQAKEKHDA